MLTDIVGELFLGLAKFIIRIFSEVVIEIFIKGLGYLACKPFKKNATITDNTIVLVGFALWIGIIGVTYLIITNWT
ncbi:hypothetical protein ACXJY6_00520 [Vibrio sp. RC27]